jgi:hypothetical protein
VINFSVADFVAGRLWLAGLAVAVDSIVDSAAAAVVVAAAAAAAAVVAAAVVVVAAAAAVAAVAAAEPSVSDPAALVAPMSVVVTAADFVEVDFAEVAVALDAVLTSALEMNALQYSMFPSRSAVVWELVGRAGQAGRLAVPDCCSAKRRAAWPCVAAELGLVRDSAGGHAAELPRLAVAAVDGASFAALGFVEAVVGDVAGGSHSRPPVSGLSAGPSVLGVLGAAERPWAFGLGSSSAPSVGVACTPAAGLGIVPSIGGC